MHTKYKKKLNIGCVLKSTLWSCKFWFSIIIIDDWQKIHENKSIYIYKCGYIISITWLNFGFFWTENKRQARHFAYKNLNLENEYFYK